MAPYQKRNKPGILVSRFRISIHPVASFPAVGVQFLLPGSSLDHSTDTSSALPLVHRSSCEYHARSALQGD